MKKSLLYSLVVLAILQPVFSVAQERPIRTLPSGSLPGRLGNITSGRSFGGTGGGAASGDSLQHRDYSEDSVAITFRLPFSTQSNKLDTSIRDFTTRFPIPAHHVFLGNLGTATRSILFSPEMKSGWDPGFHAFDVYKWKPEGVRFFNTTKPYTELNYTLGSRVEQMIEVMHTQNIRPQWNASMQYRLINSPGFFKNQKTNHNNYLFTSWFQSVNKRYNNYFVILGNKLQAGENGGLKNDQDYLSDPVYNDRFNIPTKLGGDQAFGSNFFSSALNTGNRYKEFTVSLRQQYDLGKKDSLVTDSTVIPLFYPRLRFEHTLNYSSYKYEFIDFLADSLFYDSIYSVTLPDITDSIRLYDSWKEIINEFAIYQFPDANNLQQFIKLGAGLQNLKGSFDATNKNFYNFYVQAEYRNKTRNQKWDMVLNGKLYVNGLNSGDYNAVGGLRRFVPKNGSYLELGFRNTNRTPSFVFDSRSSFYLDAPGNFQKENTTHLSASIYHPRIKMKLSGNYYLVSNYTYFTDFYKPQQENALFNVLQVSMEKVFRLGKNFNWYTDVYFQQKTGNVKLNLPLIFTRQRIALEGHFFKNLNISTGFEGRYHTPYKADNYSPATGRFFYQDSVEISNRPDLAYFLHLRIRSFKAYFRVENLNAASFENGFSFRNNNFAAPDYIYPGMQIRLGIFWNFVN